MIDTKKPSRKRGGFLRFDGWLKPVSICTESKFVMAGLVPPIHALLWRSRVDARDKRGHDGGDWSDVLHQSVAPERSALLSRHACICNAAWSANSRIARATARR